MVTEAERERRAPGARRLPLQHVSIRVLWHDRVWNGSVCADPKANTSCLILPRMADRLSHPAKEESIGLDDVFHRVTMQVFVRGIISR